MGVEGGGLSALCGIADGEQGGNGDVLGQSQNIGDFLRVEIANPAGTDAKICGLQHHVGADNGGIGLAGLIAGHQLVLPVAGAVIAYHQNHRSIEGAAAYAGQRLSGIFTLGNIDLLGLIVAGGGGDPSRFQNQIQFFFLDGSIPET